MSIDLLYNSERARWRIFPVNLVALLHFNLSAGASPQGPAAGSLQKGLHVFVHLSSSVLVVFLLVEVVKQIAFPTPFLLLSLPPRWPRFSGAGQRLGGDGLNFVLAYGSLEPNPLTREGSCVFCFVGCFVAGCSPFFHIWRFCELYLKLKKFLSCASKL